LSAALPFNKEGEIQDRAGVALATVAVTVFNNGGTFAAPQGQNYDYTGFADSRADIAFGKQNLILEVEDEQYRIVNAVKHSFMGYVELSLRQVRPNG
jgi:hypothetical protein